MPLLCLCVSLSGNESVRYVQVCLSGVCVCYICESIPPGLVQSMRDQSMLACPLVLLLYRSHSDNSIVEGLWVHLQLMYI